MYKVYFLWKFPNILPKFYTHREVFNRLANGADFMLPGVITDGPVTLYTFKTIKKNDLCSLCVKGNEAPIAVGKAHISGEDMYMSAMKGKCLNILQIFQDTLWASGDKSVQVPILPSPIGLKASSFEDFAEKVNARINKEEAAEAGEEKADEIKEMISELRVEEYLNQQETNENNMKQESDRELDHERILTDAFLVAVKFKSKDFKLPVIVSTFVKTMQASVPPNVQYDLKQTRFKKISGFLKEMEDKGVIRTKEMQKGVLSITEIYKENSDLIKFFKKPDWLKIQDEETEVSSQNVEWVFEVFELYKVDGSNEELFKGRFKRGEIVSAAEIRKFLTSYIKENNLQNPQNSKQVKLDLTMQKVFFKNYDGEFMNFDVMFNTIFSKMGHMHQIKRVYADKKERGGEEAPIFKGHFQPVEFKLEKRGGNKKVTHIHNLAMFNLDPTVLQSKLKKDIGCSVTINEPSAAVVATASSADFSLTVQGNQIFPISELLRNDFRIQLKHMKGLELGVKNSSH